MSKDPKKFFWLFGKNRFLALFSIKKTALRSFPFNCFIIFRLQHYMQICYKNTTVKLDSIRKPNFGSLSLILQSIVDKSSTYTEFLEFSVENSSNSERPDVTFAHAQWRGWVMKQLDVDVSPPASFRFNCLGWLLASCTLRSGYDDYWATLNIIFHQECTHRKVSEKASWGAWQQAGGTLRP